MVDQAKLKKKAADFEQKRQYDRALATYAELLGPSERIDDHDIALFNKVGELYLRQGQPAEALRTWERGVDIYAERGFYTNAIALCSKMLRQAPERPEFLLRLGRLKIRAGFRGDAQQHVDDYVSRMRAGKALDMALETLRLLAEDNGDDEDLQVVVAEQLAKHGRTAAAVALLDRLRASLAAVGRGGAARAVAERIRTLDASWVAPADIPHAPGTLLDESGDAVPSPPPGMDGFIFFEPAANDGPGTSGANRAAGPNARGHASVATPPRGIPAAPADNGFILGFEPPVVAPPPVPATPVMAPPAEPVPPALAHAEPKPAPRAPTPALEVAAAVAPPAPPAPVDLPVQNPGYVQPGSPDSLRPEGHAADAGRSDTGVSASDDGALPELDVLDLRRQDAGSAIGTGTLGVESALGDSGFGLPAFADANEGAAFPEDEPIDIEAAFGGPPPFSPPRPPAPAPTPAPPRTPPPATPTPAAVPRVAATPKLTPLAAPPVAPPAATGAASRPSRPFASPVPARPTQGGLRAVEGPPPGPPSPSVPPPSAAGPLPTLAEARVAAAAGQREHALAMLRTLLARHEENQRLTDVAVVLDEIVRVDADDVATHHKRVELACRLDDRTRIIGSYLGLAAALQRLGQEKRARAVYQRVLDLDPGREEARRALAAAAVPEAPAPAEPTEPAMRAGFVDLGAMLRADEPRRSTRMVIEERAPTGDEQADFAEMFRKFKQGIAESVADEDHESHYDLGVAYKEMGLVDEAIAEFQKALRGTDRRARTYEALGQCFVEKGQFRIASAVLRNALQEPGADDQQLVGVLYLLGQSAEAMQTTDEAQTFYQRVFAVDVEFRDVAARLDALAQVTR